MEIPDCYDPVRQEEARQASWDSFVEDLPVCSCCGHSVYPGNWYHETRQTIICGSCMEDLIDNPCWVEVD